MSVGIAIGEQLKQRVPGGIGRYAENILRGLVSELGDDLTIVTSRQSESTRTSMALALPKPRSIRELPVPGPIMARAWERGVTWPLKPGSCYAPSLMAPMGSTWRTIVTIHDAVPWTHPELLTTHGARWHRAMGARAERFADVIAVPTQAVAERLAAFLRVGDRVRVIPGAVSSNWLAPADADARRSRLGVPSRYVVAVGTLEPRKALDKVIASLPTVDSTVSLVTIGQAGWGGLDVEKLAQLHGVETRVHALGRVPDADLKAVISGAEALVFPSIEEGFGLPILEAFALGVPVIHSDAAALVEVAGGAGVIVAREGEEFVERLAAAIETVTSPSFNRQGLVDRGFLRLKDFSWDHSVRLVKGLLNSL